MWDILRQSLVTAPETDDLSGIGDLDLIAVNGGLYLFATTRSVPGITVLSVDPESASLAQQDREDLPDTSVFPPAGAELLWLAGQYVIIPTSRNDTALPTFEISLDGSIGSTSIMSSGPFSSDLTAAIRFNSDSTEYVLLSEFSSQALSLYHYDAGSGLVLSGQATLSADVSTIASVTVGEKRFAFAATEDDNAINTFEISGSGELLTVSEGGPEDQVGISGISRIEPVVLGNKTFILVAAFGSSSLTVLEVEQSGDLVPTDHVLDRLDTRFARASELKVLQDGDRTLVLVAGNDDGFSILELLPDGRLIPR